MEAWLERETWLPREGVVGSEMEMEIRPGCARVVHGGEIGCAIRH